MSHELLNHLFLFTFQFDLRFFANFILHPTRALIQGVIITVLAAIVAQAAGVVLGTVSALGSISRFVGFRLLSGVYVWFFRGTPTLVQIFLVYFGAPYLFGFDPFPTDMSLGPIPLGGAVIAGTVALAINEGAYMSEIVRAGVLSIDLGQTEAALSLGMSHWMTMRRIVLPQALRVIVPPLGNDFNSMLKMTSLLSVIGVQELFRVAEGVNAATFKTFEAFLGAAVYYLILLTIWNAIQRMVERRLGASTGRQLAPSLWNRLFSFRSSRVPAFAGIRHDR